MGRRKDGLVTRSQRSVIACRCPRAEHSQAGVHCLREFQGGGKSGIDHAAIVTKVTAANIYVSQHSNNQTNEPVFGRGQTWAGLDPHMSGPYWVNPYGI